MAAQRCNTTSLCSCQLQGVRLMPLFPSPLKHMLNAAFLAPHAVTSAAEAGRSSFTEEVCGICMQGSREGGRGRPLSLLEIWQDSHRPTAIE